MFTMIYQSSATRQIEIATQFIYKSTSV